MTSTGLTGDTTLERDHGIGQGLDQEIGTIIEGSDQEVTVGERILKGPHDAFEKEATRLLSRDDIQGIGTMNIEGEVIGLSQEGL